MPDQPLPGSRRLLKAGPPLQGESPVVTVRPNLHYVGQRVHEPRAACRTEIEPLDRHSRRATRRPFTASLARTIDATTSSEPPWRPASSARSSPVPARVAAMPRRAPLSSTTGPASADEAYAATLRQPRTSLIAKW